MAQIILVQAAYKYLPLPLEKNQQPNTHTRE
jgi:hypothetical protein